jgi:hypothetical protein
MGLNQNGFYGQQLEFPLVFRKDERQSYIKPYDKM